MFNIECPYCHNIDPSGTASCTKCGAQYTVDAQKICITCRNKIVGSNMFCGVCGTSIVPQQAPQQAILAQPVYVQQPQMQQPQTINVHVTAPPQETPSISGKSRGVALALCIFLGFFGGHLFYVGKAGRGILYIFTAGLFFIGVIVDFFSILGGSFKESNGLPLKNW